MAGCERYEQMIWALLDGDLAPEREAELRAHLEQCPDCRGLYEAAAAAAQVLREDLAEPPAALAEGVMARVAAYEAERGEPRPVQPVKRLRRWLPVAAAACLAVVIAGVALPRLKMGSAGSGASADTAAPQAASYVMDAEGSENARSADTPETVSLTEAMDAVAEESAEAKEDFASDEDGALSDCADAGGEAPMESAATALGYPVYDADGQAVGAVTDRERLAALLEGGTAAAGTPADYAPLYTLILDGTAYVLADDGDGGLVWWIEGDDAVTLSPAPLSELLALIG